MSAAVPDDARRAVVETRVAAFRAGLYHLCALEQRAMLDAGLDDVVVATVLPLAGVHLLADLLAHFSGPGMVATLTGHMVAILEARAAGTAAVAGMTRQ